MIISMKNVPRKVQGKLGNFLMFSEENIVPHKGQPTRVATLRDIKSNKDGSADIELEFNHKWTTAAGEEMCTDPNILVAVYNILNSQ